MVRYGHYDDPINYFRRLESYHGSRPGSFTSSNQNSYYSQSRPELYDRSQTESYTSTTDSHPSFRPTSHAEPPRVPGPREQPPSPSKQKPHKLYKHQYKNSEVSSYVGTEANSYSDWTAEKPSSPTPDKRRAFHEYIDSNREKPPWLTGRRKLFLLAGSLLLVILIIIIAVAVHAQQTAFSYTPSYAHVTNEKAFTNGAATRSNPNNTNDGIGAGSDMYTYYQGGPENFPSDDRWVSFGDMWKANLDLMKTGCEAVGEKTENTDAEIQDIYNAIQNRAAVSLVDHRFILATILQESQGCVHVGATTSSGGVRNPGLMQSHNGHSFSSYHPNKSILAMVQDGTQGTKHGAGLVQNLNKYGNLYSAARGYNSGYIPSSGDLSAAAGATACYVSDIANRLTGWVTAKSTCPGDTT